MAKVVESYCDLCPGKVPADISFERCISNIKHYDTGKHIQRWARFDLCKRHVVTVLTNLINNAGIGDDRTVLEVLGSAGLRHIENYEEREV